VRRVKGFVLAAGFGQRLRPITDAVPKPLLPVGNLPLIAYSLKLLAHHGISDVIVNTHHLGKSLREGLGNGSSYGVQITYSDEEEILGTGGGLKKMHDHLEDDTFVVINSDTVLDLDLAAAIASHRDRGALATMVLREDERQAEFGQLEIDGGGRIRRILGQGQSDGELQSLMFAGVHIVEPRFLEYIPPDVDTCVIRYVYTKALSNDEQLDGFVMDGYWSDAGTPQRYFEANMDALLQEIQLRHADPLGGFALAPKRAVPEVVRMGDDVDLGKGVEIRPPVLLGDGTRVGDHAVVGPFAIIRPRVQVGREARVSHAILLEGSRVESGARLEKVLLGRRASLPLASG
jgi:NDP-sugar pyrophosphorylase family protein